MSPIKHSTLVRTGLALSIPLVLLVVLLDGAGSPVLERTLIVGLLNLMIVLGMSTFIGNSGVVSFGHVSFVLLGAYVSGLLTIPTALKAGLFVDPPGFMDWVYSGQTSFVVGVLAAAGVCAVVGAIVAVPIVRLTGVQAGAATLAVFVIVQNLVAETDSVTRGTSTLIGVPVKTTVFVATAGAVVMVWVALAYKLSTRGLKLRAARDDAAAAQAAGIAVGRERTVAFVLSAAMVGAAGALYGHFLGSFSPTAFALPLTFSTIAMLVIGGMSSVSGATVGVLFVTVVSELLRRVEVNGLGPLAAGKAPGLTEIVISLIIIATLVFRPQGIVGAREIGMPRWVNAVRDPASDADRDETALPPSPCPNPNRSTA